MKRLAAAVMAVSLITSIFLAITPANADSGCGGLWLGADSCGLILSGTELEIFGDAFSSEDFGQAWVRVELVGPAGTVLLSCEQYGWEYAECDDSIGIDSIDLPAGVPLACNVTGNVRGHWWCATK